MVGDKQERLLPVFVGRGNYCFYCIVSDLMKAIGEDDEIAAQEVLIVKEDIQRITDAFLTRQSERIGVQDGGHLALVRLEMELLDKLRQIYTLAKRVAKDFVPQEVAEKA